MTFQSIFFQGLGLTIILMTLLWVVSVIKKNASIVDPFWGTGFAILVWFYVLSNLSFEPRPLLVATLVTIWGLRLSFYLGIRNLGKPEDFRYQKFRKDYGEHRYWWVSYFQVFLLQGILMWLISAPLLGAMVPNDYNSSHLEWIDFVAVLVWIVGFMFEAGGDYQLSQFKNNSANKGKILNTGFWKYTRHPNYFGDGFQWIGFALFSVANHCYLPVLSAVLMNLLLLKVSGVSLLEKTLTKTKPGYDEYIRKTPAFFPWFPKK